jgi:hypothetical protein
MDLYADAGYLDMESPLPMEGELEFDTEHPIQAPENYRPLAPLSDTAVPLPSDAVEPEELGHPLPSPSVAPPAETPAKPEGETSPAPEKPTENTADSDPGVLNATGIGAALKRETHSRLLTYRKSHGLGCFDALAKASSDKKLTPDVVRLMYDCNPVVLDRWKSLAAALDKLEKKVNNNGT